MANCARVFAGGILPHSVIMLTMIPALNREPAVTVGLCRATKGQPVRKSRFTEARGRRDSQGVRCQDAG